MVSVFDQPSANGCFGICNNGSENFKYDFMRQQNNLGNQLSADEQRRKKEIDDLLSEAMNQLTFQERQRQQEVLHGVQDVVSEEPTFIDASLQELDYQLMLIKKGSAYETAEILDPAYVSNTELRTLFLRCNEYDAKETASQMLQFFEVKQRLFGLQKLVQEITVNDLNEDDIEALNWIRLIGKDTAGRVVYLQFPGLRNFKTLENELRGKFYFQMWLLKSEETKKKGVVEINYAVGEFFNRSKVGYMENSQLSNSTPLFHSAIHFACDDIQEYLICKLGVKVMPPKIRARLRIHFGSHLECQYRLSTFGISKVMLPTSRGPDYHMHGSQAYLDGRLDPRHGALSLSIIFPNTNDVLYARGRAYNNKGNKLLRKLVTESSDVYDSVTSDAKKSIVDEIVQKIHASGGRFLKQVDGVQSTWITTPELEVCTKIAQMFRNQKRAEARRNLIDGTPIEDEPQEDDVIFGKRTHKNRGNDLMHNLIKERYAEYDALDRGKKVAVVNVIVDAIKGKGGRFLEPAPGESNNGYLEVSDDKARERISKYFRNYRRETIAALQRIRQLHDDRLC